MKEGRKEKKPINSNSLRAGGVIAAVSAGVSVLTLVILHATGLTDIRTDTFSIVILIIACFVFAVGLTLFFTARAIASWAAANDGEQSEEVLPEEQPETHPEPETVEEPVKEQTVTAPAALEETYDKTLTLEIICESLAKYSAECGLKMSAECARKIIAAACSSRLVALVGADDGSLVKLTQILNGFFGAKNCESFKDTVLSAYENNNAVTVAAVPLNADNAKTLSELAAYAAKPNGKVRVTVQLGYTTVSYALTPNIWAFTALNGELPPEVAAIAAFADVEFKACSESAEKSAFRRVSYFQFIKSASLCTDGFLPDEDKFFKKFDKFEKIIKDGCGYSADNKKRRLAEVYSSAYLACGGENAPDNTAAAHFAAPAVAAGMKGADFVRAAEETFGEENAAACKKITKAVKTV